MARHVRCADFLARSTGVVRPDIVCLVQAGEQNPLVLSRFGTIYEHDHKGGRSLPFAGGRPDRSAMPKADEVSAGAAQQHGLDQRAHPLGVAGPHLPPALCAARGLALAEAFDRSQPGFVRATLGAGRGAVTNGVLPGAPRPRSPPERTLPSQASSISTRPDSGLSPSRRAITAMIFCFITQAVACLTPSRRPGSTDEMPFFAVTIRAQTPHPRGNLEPHRRAPILANV